MNTNRWIKDNWPLLIGVAVAGYYVYKAVKGIGSGLNKAGESIGSSLADALLPSGAGESAYLSVTFEDGSTHAIPASSVSMNQFVYKGQTYTMVNDAQGRHYAISNA
jgi:hypothetical protein